MSGNKAELRLPLPENKLDARARRTRARLAASLRTLMQEKPLSKISVQDVLDHAHVSRSAFYSHYSGKVDLLLTDMDEFLESAATHLSRAGDPSERVAVVTEFFDHVANAEQIRTALARSARLGDFYELARQHFARGIERRLKELPRSHVLQPLERSALAHAMAGALIAQLDWWLSKRRPVTAEDMDRRFHQLLWSSIPMAESKRGK
ncbi:MAG TPA: TetR/AcrR family transcriptional regulator [Terriglobales bacterium]|nr:TetR/AcrR family transcriptional regulator [Terriglobales bacterium]